MPEKKRQHYVPREYLKGFSHDGKNIAIHAICNSQTIPKAAYDNQCYKDYFYGKDLMYENLLSEYETKWGVILKKLRCSTEYYPVAAERELLQKFMVFQRQRTEAQISHSTQIAWEMTSELAKMKFEHDGFPELKGYSLDDFDRGLSSCEPLIKNDYKNIAIKTAIEIAEEASKYLDDMELRIISYHTNSKLITSDNPVVFINPYSPYNVGLEMAGLVAFVPISSEKLVVFLDRKMYGSRENLEYSIINENEVKCLNIHQFINANKILIAQAEQDLDEIAKSYEARQARLENKSFSAVSSLGTKDNKIMASKPQICVVSCKLSFCKVPNAIKMIDCRAHDIFPRQYKEEWKQRYISKPNLLSTDIPGKGKLEPKSFIKEVIKMNKYIFKYWNS